MTMEFYYIAGALAAGAAGFGIFFQIYRRRQTARFVELYKKLEVSESASRRVKEQFLKLQEEAVALRESLERERRAREENAAGLRETARKKMVSLGAACLVSGVFLGTVMAGVLTYSLSEIRHLRQTVEYQVLARTSEARADLLGKELSRVTSQYQRLSEKLLTVREDDAVARAKLGILLDQLSGRRIGSKLTLDVEAMRESLRQSGKPAEAAAETFLAPGPALKV